MKQKKKIHSNKLLAKGVLTADPGEHGGWSYWFDNEYQNSGTVKGTDIKEVITILEAFNPNLLIIEDQYRGAGVSWTSLKSLIGRRYLWEWMARERDIAVYPVMPSTWRGWCRVKDRDQYITVASGVMGRRPQTVDEAVAVLIGVWWTGQSQRAKMQRSLLTCCNS